MPDIDENNPADNAIVSTYPANERSSRSATKTIIDSAEDGKHRKSTYNVQSSDPAAVANAVITYAKDVGSKAELHSRDEDGNIAQLTSKGGTSGPRHVLPQQASDPAGEADKLTIYSKANSEGIVELFARLETGTIIRLSPSIGDLKPSVNSTADAGWLLCNGDTIGSAASGADHANDAYETLFEILKTAWGNAGTEVWANDETVKLPDSRGRSLMGSGTGPDTAEGGGAGTARTLGSKVGKEDHTLTEAELPAHHHKMFRNGVVSSTTGIDGDSIIAHARASGSGSANYDMQPTTGAIDAGKTSDSGSGDAHTTVQPNLVVNYQIYAGI